jgi:hypothetical protein
MTIQPYNTTMSWQQLVKAVQTDIAALYAAIAAISVPGPANPTAKVALNAVNGIAATFMRSDAAPPIDVTINVTWTGTHIFTPTAAATSVTINAVSGQSALQVNGNGNAFAARFASGASAAGVFISNASQGAGTAGLRIDSSATTGARTATFTATNKPGSGTTAPSNWLPVLLDGTLYYIPCWT